MSKIDELRALSIERRNKRESIYGAVVREAVAEVVNAGTFTLSAANHIGSDVKPDEVMANFVQTVAEKTVDRMSDPKVNFLQTMSNRKFSSRGVRSAVEQVYIMFFKELDVSYENKLEAVALQLEENPALWDSLVPLSPME